MMKLNSLRETEEKYGVTVAMLKKLIANNQIERVKIGAKNFISEEVIEAYIEANTIKVAS